MCHHQPEAGHYHADKKLSGEQAPLEKTELEFINQKCARACSSQANSREENENTNGRGPRRECSTAIPFIIHQEVNYDLYLTFSII